MFLCEFFLQFAKIADFFFLFFNEKLKKIFASVIIIFVVFFVCTSQGGQIMKRFLKELFPNGESVVGVIVMIMLLEALIYAVTKLNEFACFSLIMWFIVSLVFLGYKALEHFSKKEYLKTFKYVVFALILICIGIVCCLLLEF